MRTASFFVPRLALAPALSLAVAACGNGGTGVDRLTPEQVGGTYAVCSLDFTPQQAIFPPVNVRAEGMGPRVPPALRMRTDQSTFAIEYTNPQDDLVPLGGTYQLGASTVALIFTGTAAQRAMLLLPNRLDLEFQAQPKQLTTLATPATYAVPRANYAQLAGISEAGLANEIPGTLSARFAVGACE